jgi:hypothetical protein
VLHARFPLAWAPMKNTGTSAAVPSLISLHD